MPTPSITFVTQRPEEVPSATRADVAMFVGRIGRRASDVPDRLRGRLTAMGFSPEGVFSVGEERLTALLDMPVPVESWSEFDTLFDWKSQPELPGDAAPRLPCPIGLSIRQFFEQGGAKAYVVRTGDPLPLAEPALSETDFKAERQALLSRPNNSEDGTSTPMLPGWRGVGRDVDPLDLSSWRGVAHVYAVEDAAMLLLPDLVQLCAGPPETPPPLRLPPGPPEQFIPCAPAVPGYEAEERSPRPEYLAPRLDTYGYRRWASALHFVLDLLGHPRGSTHRRDIMLVAALPLPDADPDYGSDAAIWPLDLLARPGLADGNQPLFSDSAIGNARLQLAYPWLATRAARECPEGLQGGEGALAGIIARSALEKGAFRTAAGQGLRGTVGLYPDIPGSVAARGRASDADWLGDRISLFALRRGHVELASDATMASNIAWREGGVSRLMAILLRVARTVGEDLVFEPSGPQLWNRLRNRMETVMVMLRRLGAFDGGLGDSGYQVTCDRTTMTQADVDAGRVLCRIAFTPAHAIERITVTLTLLDTSGGLQEAA